jgi:antirestriction protein ArdC
VTARIIADLEAGCLPWVQPWDRNLAQGCAAPGLPRNGLSGRAYSGINILLLWGEGAARVYPTQDWVTFRQALAAGGHVRKGEAGTGVFYADSFVPEAEKARARDEGGEAHAIPFLKRFTLFNVAQCEGLEGKMVAPPLPLALCAAVPIAEAVIAASGVAFHIGGGEAYYAPGADRVQVPPQSAFAQPINYYRTALHELTHATGHASRLARDLAHRFGTPGYAAEELVAEMGSAFLCAALGIVPTVRHADYIGSWLALLRDDSRAIFRAARAASRAADWLLERHRAAMGERDEAMAASFQGRAA